MNGWWCCFKYDYCPYKPFWNMNNTAFNWAINETISIELHLFNLFVFELNVWHSSDWQHGTIFYERPKFECNWEKKHVPESNPTSVLSPCQCSHRRMYFVCNYPIFPIQESMNSSIKINFIATLILSRITNIQFSIEETPFFIVNV